MKLPHKQITNFSTDQQKKSLKSMKKNLNNQEEEADLYQPQQFQKQRVQPNNITSFWDDLIKLLQLSVVLVLVIFICAMGYLIVAEVSQFWFGMGKNASVKTENQKLIKIQDIQKNQINDGRASENIDSSVESQQHQLEQALRGDQNDQSQVQKSEAQRKGSQRAEVQNIKIQIQQISQSNPQKAQLYDPVLIQLKRYRDRLGPGYKQTIYTMKNTSITQAQYLRAKNLIELPKFYNSKEKRFVVKQNTQGESCGSEDPQCEKKQKYIESIVGQEISYYEQKYHSAYTQINSELPFCIIIPSYKNNHGDNILRNLNSVFQQQYINFHVVYIDDASKDGTPDTVKDYMKKYEIEQSKLLFIENTQNQKALKNIYTAAHQHCKQKQIMIIVDGDDYLIGTQVLRFLNYEYQTKTLLAAYTNYLRINEPYYIKVGTSTPYHKYIIDRRGFRKTPKMFRASHLRSYYVDLFRKIKPEDLKDDKGEFFSAANDFAIMMPILEMAAPYLEYLPELAYLYDSGTGLNNFQSKKGIQERNVKTVSKRKMYDQVDWEEFYPKQ